MITDEIVQQIFHKIQTWKSEEKIIIGIEGYSGTGKSTLLKMLQEKDKSILPVHRDDFLIPRKEFQAIFAESSDKGKAMEYQTVDVNEIIHFAETFRQKNGSQKFILRADESAGNMSGEKKYGMHFRFFKKNYDY